MNVGRRRDSLPPQPVGTLEGPAAHAHGSLALRRLRGRSDQPQRNSRHSGKDILT
jgi:hypothetical protein